MVYNERMEPVESPDLKKGEVVASVAIVDALWVVDEPEVTELRVAKRYANGGMVAEEAVVSPERGHWDAPEWAVPWLDANGDRNERHHGVPIELYREFTAPEIAAMERADELQMQVNSIPEQAQREIEELKAYASSVDELACALYEELSAREDEAASTDAAICSLYEAMIGEGVEE